VRELVLFFAGYGNPKAHPQEDFPHKAVIKKEMRDAKKRGISKEYAEWLKKEYNIDKRWAEESA
jgi:hypothetical protein